VVYLAQPDPDGERLLQEVTFDDEHSSALYGTIVWKALAERDKVFDDGQFTARALIHNLRESDFTVLPEGKHSPQADHARILRLGRRVLPQSPCPPQQPVAAVPHR
jgi:hypothetical protein